MNSKKRIYQIDLFRFFAALIVVLFHYFFRGHNDNSSNLNFSEIGGFFKYGYLGVNIFYIISGFVIALSIKDRSLVKFFISRVSRLYPVYWICVLLTYIIIISFGAPIFTASLSQFMFNLTMFQNYMGVENIDGVYWSLFVEIKFYIFVVGFYLFLNKIKQIKLDYLIYFWTLLSIAYLFFNDFFILKLFNYFFILNWSSYFIAGMLFYQIFKHGMFLKYLIILLCALSISIYYAILRIDNIEITYNTSFSPYIIGSVIIVFYVLMLLVSTNKLKRINLPKFAKLGVLTYPLYLLHQRIGYIIFNNLGVYINKYFLVISTIVFMII
ncbi:acyltransferase, partial [Winogradskyella sp.]|nr:acyltransferase [Winogradskyella sp.]